MKTPIEAKDIRKGDLIRCEYTYPIANHRAIEYEALEDKEGSGYAASYYLLERPEPPFEPYWGMRLQHPHALANAIYVPYDYDNGHNTWALTIDGEFLNEFMHDEWAKQKLAEGWIEIKGNKND